MAQKKPGAETAQKSTHLADVEQLADSLMREIAGTRQLRLEQASTFERVVRLAGGALVGATYSEAECIAKLRARLGEVVALCTNAECDLRVRVADDDRRGGGAEYIGPLTYIHYGPDNTVMTNAITVTGPRGSFYLPQEGRSWIRGHHAPESREAKGLIENFKKGA